jgi:group II intron reverse transcriptase/maturase
VNWIIDADIRGFFDNISHEWLMKFLAHRIADPRMLRLLKKWLRAGVSEDGEWSPTTTGTPQGAVISPLYANVFLHYVLDLWINDWRKRQAKGEVTIVRYADDFVLGFREESDARRCLADLKGRFAKFGLELHPEKTRLIEFGRYAEERRAKRDAGPPETFDFLGFTHICAQGPDGRFRLVRRTSRKKRLAKQATLADEIERRKHHRVVEQHKWLSSVLRGHFNYYGVPGNYSALRSFHRRIRCTWHRALQRRSQRARWTDSKRDAFDARFPLPRPRITHTHPLARFSRP